MSGPPRGSWLTCTINGFWIWLTAPIPHKDRMAIYSPAMRERFAKDQVAAEFARLFEDSRAQDVVNRVLDVDIKTYLTDNILTKVDIASMAHSLEVRQPLLDHRVVEFAASLPVNLKFRGRRGKLILQDAFGSMIPRSIFTRSKMGFGIPIGTWFRNELKPMVHDLLLAEDARIAPFFRSDAVAQLVRSP